MPKLKALVLLSGGLDSILAAKVLQAQGTEVQGICFRSNFFSSEKAKKAAESIGIKLNIVDISNELLEIVKNPPSGYGKHLNPCIDCHALMTKKASEIKEYNVIATGEVLGQRPFSQKKEALARVEKLAGVEILRPLSAKLLPETEIEKKGLVNRGRLLNIRGRGRGRQMELAQKYNIKEYSTPAGGCLLTDPEFSQRLGKMLDYWPDCTTDDVQLLKFGRIFWQNSKGSKKILLIVGRHQTDDKALEKFAKPGDIILELKDIPGPLTLLRAKNYKFKLQEDILKINVPSELKKGELKLSETKSEDEILKIAGLLTGWYAIKARGKKVKIEVKNK